MVSLSILMIITLAAGCTGVYLVVKKFCWREVLNYVPFISAAAFAVLCVVLMLTGISSVKSREYNTAYAVGYDDGESVMTHSYTEDKAELEAMNETELADTYSEAYGRAFREFAEILGASLSKEISVKEGNEEGVLELIIEDEEEPEGTEDVTRSGLPDESEGGSISEDVPEQEVTVYYTKSGSVLHKDKNCHYLKNASQIYSSELSEAPNRKMCSSCG